MALIKDVTRVIDVPGENETITIRALSWRQLEEAAEKQQTRAMAKIKDMGGDILKAIISGEVGAESFEREAKKSGNPAAAYDMATVLKHGVASWSYGADVDTDQLDSVTARLCHAEIIKLTQGDEGERKKG